MTELVMSKPDPWLVIHRPNPQATLRLFCFPYSGAGAHVFLKWPDEFPSSVEVCPVQFPGRGSRLAEPPFRRIAPLVSALARALLPYLDKPFAFFGHSLGALVSFELARRLAKQAKTPVHLFVSGHGAPQIPVDEPPIHALPEREFLDKLRSLNGTPAEVLAHAELLQLVVPILRADFEVCETYAYQPGGPLACPLSAYGGLQDGYVSRERLEAWREHTTAAFSVRMFQGDHFYLNTMQPLLCRTLARELGDLINLGSVRPLHDVSLSCLGPAA